jgi:hypothetical protein
MQPVQVPARLSKLGGNGMGLFILTEQVGPIGKIFSFDDKIKTVQ